MAAPLDDALAQTDRGLTPAWPIDPVSYGIGPSRLRVGVNRRL